MGCSRVRFKVLVLLLDEPGRARGGCLAGMSARRASPVEETLGLPAYVTEGSRRGAPLSLFLISQNSCCAREGGASSAPTLGTGFKLSQLPVSQVWGVEPVKQDETNVCRSDSFPGTSLRVRCAVWVSDLSLGPAAQGTLLAPKPSPSPILQSPVCSVNPLLPTPQISPQLTCPSLKWPESSYAACNENSVST